jgi:hypothetical protein
MRWTMRRENDVSRLPYLSSYAKGFLGELAPPPDGILQVSRHNEGIARTHGGSSGQWLRD